MGKVLDSFENQLSQSVIEECSTTQKSVGTEMGLISSDTASESSSSLVSVTESGAVAQKELLMTRNDVMYMGKMCGVILDSAFDRNKESVLKKAGNLGNFGEAHGFQAEGTLLKRSHGTLFTSVGIIHIPMFGNAQRFTYNELCCSSLLRVTNTEKNSISVSFGDIAYIQAGTSSYEYLIRMRSIILSNINKAKVIFYDKYCQLLDKISSAAFEHRYEDAHTLYQTILSFIYNTPFSSCSSPELQIAILEAMHKYDEASNIPNLSAEQKERIRVHKKEYLDVLHQNDIEDAHTYYSQKDYDNALTSISNGLKTTSEESLWQLLENTINEYASLNNSYLFGEIEKILSSAQEGDMHRSDLLDKAVKVCRNDALEKYEEQNYKECFHMIRYAMATTSVCENWDLINKIAENVDLNDTDLIDEIVRTANGFKYANEFSHITDILNKRYYSEADKAAELKNYRQSIVLLNYAMCYKTEVPVCDNRDLINKIAENIALDDTNLINELIKTANGSKDAYEYSHITDILNKRYYSEAEKAAELQNYSQSIILLSNALRYKEEPKETAMLERIIAEHDCADTDAIFKLIKKEVLPLQLSDETRASVAEKMSERLYSEANKSFENKDYPDALEKIRSAVGETMTPQICELYGAIVSTTASEQNDYLNSDVNKLLSSDGISSDVKTMLHELDNKYQSTLFDKVRDRVKCGDNSDFPDSVDCLNQTDKYGMTIAMYAALYRNTEAIKMIAEKYGNPALSKQKNILGLGFIEQSYFAYDSSVLDNIGELFPWFVKLNEEYASKLSDYNFNNKMASINQRIGSTVLSNAQRRNNYEAAGKACEFLSNVERSNAVNHERLNRAGKMYDEEVDRWQRVCINTSWSKVLKYVVLELREKVDLNTKNIEKSALERFTDEYLQENLTEKDEFETTKAYIQRTEDMKKTAKKEFENNKADLTEIYINKTNAESEEYNLPIQLARLFIESKLNEPVTLGKYDADSQKFSIVWNGFAGEFNSALSIPLDAAPAFKQSLTDGTFAIVPKSYRTTVKEEGGYNLFIECSVEFENKEYSYELWIIINLRPLEWSDQFLLNRQ